MDIGEKINLEYRLLQVKEAKYIFLDKLEKVEEEIALNSELQNSLLEEENLEKYESVRAIINHLTKKREGFLSRISILDEEIIDEENQLSNLN